MRILFINASPRQSGLTSMALDEMIRQLESEHDCEKVNINSANIKPCIGCLSCRPDKACVLPEDDGHKIARKIMQVDALVMGSPTYFGNITGPLRTLIDRSLTAIESIAASGLEAPVPKQTGKKAAIVTVCNMPAPHAALANHGGGALAAMEIVTNAGGYTLAGKVLIDGAAARDGLSAELKNTLRMVAAALVQ